MHFKVSFAICYNLDQYKILSFGNEVNLNLTIPSFNNPRDNASKRLWEKEHLFITNDVFHPSERCILSLESQLNLNGWVQLRIVLHSAIINIIYKYSQYKYWNINTKILLFNNMLKIILCCSYLAQELPA